MIGISITFPTGKYHATPWDKQVKEGAVEYPPSPWRILRALLASYYKMKSRPPEKEVGQLLARLAGELPKYKLPPTAKARSVQMVPVKPKTFQDTVAGKNRQEIHDTFLSLPKDEPIVICWTDLCLDLPSILLLQRLCGGIGYLGRAESWAELQVILEVPEQLNAYADPTGNVKVLAPEESLADNPDTIIGRLGIYTSDIVKDSGIPGARWVKYRVETSLPARMKTLSRSEVELPEGAEVNFARFALHARVPIRLRKAVVLGNTFHRRLIKLCEEPVFTGKINGFARLDNHLHAYYLPEADSSANITHLLVYAREGFSTAARFALWKMCECPLFWEESGHEIQLSLIQLGKSKEYAFNNSLFRASIIWESLTPVVLPRYPKRKKSGEIIRDSCEEQVQKMLKDLGISIPCQISLLDNPVEWQQFYLHRPSGKGDRSLDRGFGLKLRFDFPVPGPIAVGYGSHYGLGCFIAP